MKTTNFGTPFMIVRSLGCLLFAIRLVSLCDSIPADEPPSSAEDTAIHVPTPPEIVVQMLEMARVNKDDLLYDLGCGDGRIVIAAASTYGCRAVGFDMDARKVQQSRANVKKQGVEKLVQIEHQDIFKLDLREATVITLFLLPEMNLQLIPQLEQLKAGSRIVCHEFPFPGFQHDRLVTIKTQGDGVPRDVYLYRLPLKKTVTADKQAEGKGNARNR